MLPQLALLLVRSDFLALSLPNLLGEARTLDFTTPPVARCEPHKYIGPFKPLPKHAAAITHALSLAHIKNFHAKLFKELSFHRVCGDVFTHKSSLERGDLIMVDRVDQLVQIIELFEWEGAPYLLGCTWTRCAIQDVADKFHSAWERSPSVFVGRASRVLGKAWTNPAPKGPRIIFAPYLERHMWWWVDM
jgi:hypothetical protein